MNPIDVDDALLSVVVDIVVVVFTVVVVLFESDNVRENPLNVDAAVVDIVLRAVKSLLENFVVKKNLKK